MILLDVRTSEFIINYITIAIAYIVTTSIAGFSQAFIADKLGDSTPREAGFLTLNPLVHVDPIGALLIFFVGIGWGKFIPIDTDRFKNWFEIACVFLTKPMSYLVCAFVSLILLVGAFGAHALNLIMVMVVSDYVSLSALAASYPAYSSLTLSLAMILIMIIYIGVTFAVLNLILGGVRFFQAVYFSHSELSTEAEFLLFFIPLIIMVFFAPSLKLLVSYGISYGAYMLLTLLGVV